MTKNTLSIALLLLVGLFFASCDPDEPEVDNEEELITTLEYTLTPTDGGTDIVLRFEDLDGDGGDDPTITGGILAANMTYNGSITLSNESEDPSEDITIEIMEEDEDHQFFFQSNLSNIAIGYNDMDANSNPIGLSTILVTGAAELGALKIILRHEPNKSADGVSIGDVTNAGGETDIEVTFPVDVQ